MFIAVRVHYGETVKWLMRTTEPIIIAKTGIKVNTGYFTIKSSLWIGSSYIPEYRLLPTDYRFPNPVPTEPVLERSLSTISTVDCRIFVKG